MDRDGDYDNKCDSDGDGDSCLVGGMTCIRGRVLFGPL